jgi:hypothetical protein
MKRSTVIRNYPIIDEVLTRKILDRFNGEPITTEVMDAAKRMVCQYLNDRVEKRRTLFSPNINKVTKLSYSAALHHIQQFDPFVSVDDIISISIDTDINPFNGHLTFTLNVVLYEKDEYDIRKEK